MRKVKLLMALLLVSACNVVVPSQPIEEVPQEEVPQVVTFDSVKEQIKVSVTSPTLKELAPMYNVCSHELSIEMPSDVSKVEVNIYYYDKDNAPLLDTQEGFQCVDMVIEESGTYDVVGFSNDKAIASDVEIIYIEMKDGTILN